MLFPSFSELPQLSTQVTKPPRSAVRAVRAVRRFNRFYTQRIGVLAEALDQSPFTLAEARVMYEVAHGKGTTASRIADDLAMDAGYLSRLLAVLGRRKLVRRERSKSDGRQSHLELTAAGRKAFRALEASTERNIGQLLRPLPTDAQSRLVNAIQQVEWLLTEPTRGSPCRLRSHRPGDLGWVVERHGELYAREFGWDGRFEGLVAEIVASFLKDLDPAKERCWIAERNGQRVGSVMLVRHTADTAQLRLLLVDPAARGIGLGRRLVQECIRFATSAGYSRMTLWTNDILVSARRIYEAEGFRLVASEPHHSFGHDLVSQTWQRVL